MGKHLAKVRGKTNNEGALNSLDVFKILRYFIKNGMSLEADRHIQPSHNWRKWDNHKGMRCEHVADRLGPLAKAESSGVFLLSGMQTGKEL